MEIIIKLDSHNEGSELVTPDKARPGELDEPIWGLYELPVYDDDFVHEWQYDLVTVAEGLTYAQVMALADDVYPECRILG